MNAANPSTLVLREQFNDAQQQRHAAELGMWVFLTTEVLFFGGLFTAYAYYRMRYPEAFHEASEHLYLSIGASNTAILLVSSFTMALAVRFASVGRLGATSAALSVTALLGMVFLGLKGFEYMLDYHEQLVPILNFHYDGPADPRHVALFMVIYFIATGIHALHLSVAVGLVLVLLIMNHRRRFNAEYHTPVEMIGLYWHFVDIVWIFLLPLLYMAEP